MLIKTTKKSTIGLTLFNWFKKKGGHQGVGLALSGGAARGVTHLGVLYALEEHHVPIQFIAGVSSGALVGGLYAAGVPVKLIIENLGLFHGARLPIFIYQSGRWYQRIRPVS